MPRRATFLGSRLPVLLMAALGVTGFAGTAVHGRPDDTGAATRSDQAPTPLVDSLDAAPVRRQRTEQQEDALEARALYLHGRMLLQRRELAAALRGFQRAWRFNSLLVSPMQDIVSLAASLDRDDEAARYAVIAAEQETVPPALVDRIARILASRLQFERALGIYQRLLARPAEQRDRPLDVAIQLEIGRLNLLLDRPQLAADAFAEVWQALKPDSPAPLTRQQRDQLLPNPELGYSVMGEAFLNAGRLEEAETLFRQAHAVKPNPGLLGLRLAQIAQRRGDAQAALRELDTYFQAKLDVAGSIPYQLLTELLDPQPPTDPDPTAPPAPRPPSPAVLAKLAELATADPDNLALGYYLAEQQRRADQLEQAEQRFASLLKRRPAAEGYQGLARVYLQRRDWPKLLEQLGTVVVQTGSLMALQPVVDELVARPEPLQQITDSTWSLVRDAQRTPPEGAVMAVTLLQLAAEHLEPAEALFAEAMKRPDAGRGPFALGFALDMMAQQRPQPAVRALQTILDEKLITENVAELYHALAGALSLAEEPDQALVAARRAAELAPDSPRMVARGAWVQYFAKRYEPAEQALRALVARYDGDFSSEEPRAVLRDVRQMLSAIAAEQQRYDDAERWLLEVLDEFPEDIGALNDLGYLWCDQRIHLHRALVMIEQAVAAEPDNVAYRDSLGWALYRLARYDEAVQQLEQAAASEPVDGVILDHLGDAYAKTNRQPEAVTAWKKAAAKFQEDGDQRRLQEVQAKLQAPPPQ